MKENTGQVYSGIVLKPILESVGVFSLQGVDVVTVFRLAIP
jgi:hypothetical protein